MHILIFGRTAESKSFQLYHLCFNKTLSSKQFFHVLNSTLECFNTPKHILTLRVLICVQMVDVFKSIA